MTAAQTSFPVAPSKFSFARHGRSGQEFSETIPHIASISDKIAVIRSMHTEQINHDPAITFLQTGHQLAGRPSLGFVALVRARKREQQPACVPW